MRESVEVISNNSELGRVRQFFDAVECKNTPGTVISSVVCYGCGA
jgi:hypothetical protein